MLLGDEPEDNPYAYLDEAAKLTRQAADKGADPFRTKQLGAQVELIKVLTPALYAEGDPSVADSVLSQMNIEAIQEPSVLNDLGVLRFTQKRWQDARAFFQRTIAVEPEFKEAYYNLALTEDRMNNARAAQKAMNQYLQLEEDVAWRRAARHFLQNL